MSETLVVDQPAVVAGDGFGLWPRLPAPVELAVLHGYAVLLRVGMRMLPIREPLLLSGPGASLQLCEAIARDGRGRVLIVTDALLAELGLLTEIRTRLAELGLRSSVYDGVQPDPTIDQVEAGLSLLKADRCDAVLAVGGGSPIDAAKAIAARASNDRPLRQLTGILRLRRRPLPLYAIPTTAGTGSEVTMAAVITDPVRSRKLPIFDPRLVPDRAALDGRLATGLPAQVTLAGGMDALTHAVEAYLSRAAQPKSDRLALEAVRLLLHYLPLACGDRGADIDVRQHLALAAHDAGLAMNRAGVGYVHAIAHALGGRYHVPHGLLNAMVLPWVLDYSRPACSPRLAVLARLAGLAGPGDGDAVLAGKFIARIRIMNRAFGIPDGLAALRGEDIPAIARDALREANLTYAPPRPMRQADCEAVLRRLLVDAGRQ